VARVHFKRNDLFSCLFSKKILRGDWNAGAGVPTSGQENAVPTKTPSQISRVAAIDDARIERFESFRKRHFTVLKPANLIEESLVEIMAVENWRRFDPRLPEKSRERASRNFDRALKSLTRLRRLAGRGPLPPLPTLRPRPTGPQPPASAVANVIEMPLRGGEQTEAGAEMGTQSPASDAITDPRCGERPLDANVIEMPLRGGEQSGAGAGMGTQSPASDAITDPRCGERPLDANVIEMPLRGEQTEAGEGARSQSPAPDAMSDPRCGEPPLDQESRPDLPKAA
jgi:hypothetical protein